MLPMRSPATRRAKILTSALHNNQIRGEELRQERQQIFIQLRKDGWSDGQIGVLCGMTSQRVWQIINYGKEKAEEKPS